MFGIRDGAWFLVPLFRTPHGSHTVHLCPLRGPIFRFGPAHGHLPDSWAIIWGLRQYPPSLIFTLHKGGGCLEPRSLYPPTHQELIFHLPGRSLYPVPTCTHTPLPLMVHLCPRRGGPRRHPQNERTLQFGPLYGMLASRFGPFLTLRRGGVSGRPSSVPTHPPEDIFRHKIQNLCTHVPTPPRVL